MTTAIIVQARVGSTRLPGKVLKPLGAHTVLEEVLRRCRAVQACDVVVCAIPDQPEDDALASVAERAGAVVTRGSAQDVLARYAAAAEAAQADVVMRVTSDCPLIDPALCDAVLALRAAENADYACNNMPPSFPHGLDCEAFTAAVLHRANAAATQAAEREHVTPWLRNNPALRRFNLSGPGGPDAHHRWTLDFADDYEFLSALFSILPPPPAIPSWQETLRLVAEHPGVGMLNAAKRVLRAV